MVGVARMPKGGWLDSTRAHKAIEDYMQYAKEHAVHVRNCTQQCSSEPRQAPVNTGWEDSNTIPGKIVT